MATSSDTAMSDSRLISFVLPVYDEEASLKELHAQISQVMQAQPDDHELIFVDDGSTDGSFEVLRELQRQELDLTNLVTHHATLEDVFVSMTGRHLEKN